MNISLPYGKEVLEGELPDERVVGMLCGESEADFPDRDGWEVVADSLRNPIGSPPLREVARGKRKVVLIASDHTRPVPSKVIVPQMLQEVRAGNPDAQITILVATGCHRPSTQEELLDKFGAEILKQEIILVHDSAREEDMVRLGTLPSGGELYINKLAAQADLLISEGFIEPHFFAGFSGGRKSVLPGIAARRTVYANHCAEFIAHPKARCGILDGNPIHRDMLFAAKAARLAFVVNVVLDAQQSILASFAGDCDAAHRAGAQLVQRMCQCQAVPADIVITSNNGYPLDQNIYQAVKGMCTAEACVAPHGVILMAAQCQDGCGGEGFWKTFATQPDAKKILEEIEQVPMEETAPDQWQSQIFARILAEHPVVFISSAPDDVVRAMHMYPAHSIAQGLEIADQILGRKGTITVIPHGVSTIVTK
ncbi:MAG: nickel-dependent lactate racemase [Lawsonibacter sp.]|jgi:nickel-dependent lactate racemase